jgi:acyl dehydratase
MANPFRKRAAAGLKPGDAFRYRRTFSEAETAAFGDLTRDYNPVHYDRRWTELKGYRGLVCHGLLVGSMICEFGGQVGWLASAMSFKFIKPVYCGDTVTCEAVIRTIDARGRAEAEAQFWNQDGEPVGYAHLRGRVPLEAERGLLARMMAEGDPTNRLAEECYPPLPSPGRRG